MTTRFTLERTPQGRLLLGLPDGERHEGVVPVRSFPLSAPEVLVSLVSPQGRELLAIERLDELPEPIRALLLEELAPREFMPKILSIDKVSTFATPSTWRVSTDRGESELILKAEEDIRRIDRGRLLVTDSYGLNYLIEDPVALDARSRRFLERFL